METDDDIKKTIDFQLDKWGAELVFIEITYFREENELKLMLHFIAKNYLSGEFIGLGENPEGTKYYIEIGKVSIYQDDYFNTFKSEARKLYFRLRKEYPMLKRNMGYK